MHKTLKLLFEGVYDPESDLHAFLGMPHIIQKIWVMIKCSWKSHIKLPMIYQPAHYTEGTQGTVTASEVGFFWQRRLVSPSTPFPQPTNININMMPFLASRNFEETQLPDYIKPYAKMIRSVILCACGYNNVNRSKVEGKIFFLTIQESWVEDNTSQRRPGLHTDNPGPIIINKSCRETTTKAVSSCNEGSGSLNYVLCDHDWGIGVLLNESNEEGGIYLMSNVENSCRVWDCKIKAHSDGEETISSFGDIEHLRPFLPEDNAVILKANYLCWITDRTPHESLPLNKRQFRQFFRVVTSEVSLWFTDDNTENPNGVKPDSRITKIIKGSKFNPKGMEILEQ